MSTVPLDTPSPIPGPTRSVEERLDDLLDAYTGREAAQLAAPGCSSSRTPSLREDRRGLLADGWQVTRVCARAACARGGAQLANAISGSCRAHAAGHPAIVTRICSGDG